MGATSSYHRKLVKAHVRLRIKRWLRFFGLPIMETLQFFRVNKISASGSAVLAMILGELFIPNDFDLYLIFGLLEVMDQFLTQFTTYGLLYNLPLPKKEYQQYYEGQTGISSSRIYICSRTNRSINVIEVSPLLPVATAPTFLFHSTPVMNYLTWNTIVSGYPRLTHKMLGIVNEPTFYYSDRVEKCVEKYEDRGFRFLQEDDRRAVHICGVHPHCPLTVRCISDSATMRVGFHEEGDEQEMDLIDPFLSWRLSSPGRCRHAGNMDDDNDRPVIGFVVAGDGTIVSNSGCDSVVRVLEVD
ncbi:hypothetical protein MD484_g5621, partial [Candolleomyces efflorescens]